MPDTLFFNHKYHHTNKENAMYFVEINAQKEVFFYVQGASDEPFYRDRVNDISNKNFLIMYLSVLLKSVMEQQY